MTQPARFLLAHERDRAGVGRAAHELLGERVLAIAAQRNVELESMVEVILDRSFHASRNDDNMLDAD